jgi:hypothetical protein
MQKHILAALRPAAFLNRPCVDANVALRDVASRKLPVSAIAKARVTTRSTGFPPMATSTVQERQRDCSGWVPRATI